MFSPEKDEVLDNLESLFDNSIIGKGRDEKSKSFLMKLVDHVFNRLERICVLVKHEYFNEVEAAIYCRLSDPEGKGRKVIRNYALRTKKCSYSRLGKSGLLFSRSDLDELIKAQKLNSYREVLGTRR